MTQKKKYVAVAAGSLVVVFIGYMSYAIPLANEAKKIGQYNNPDIQASLEAIRQNPNDAAAHSSAAHYYMVNSADDAKVVRHFQEVVRIEPDNREAKFLLASRLRKLGKKAESKKLFQELTQQQDDWGKSARKHLDSF